MSFEDYTREKVLEPYGLKNTFAEVPGAIVPDKVSFYSRGKLGFRDAISVDNRYKLAGGGYLSTAVDIASFGQMFLDATLREGPVMSQFLTSGTIGGHPTYYGLGWQVSEDMARQPYFGHIGNGVGGYAVFYVYPEVDMVFSILTNCTDPGVQDILEEVISSLIDKTNANR